MNKTIVTYVLVFIFILAALFSVYLLVKSEASETNATSRLSGLISKITPAYNIETRTPEIIDIENALTEVLIDKGLEDGNWIAEHQPSPVKVLGFNSRYVLYDSGNPYTGNVTTIIFDVESENNTGSIPMTYVFSTNDYAIYAAEQYLCRYVFGFQGCEIINESKLVGDEVYGDSSSFGGNLILEEGYTYKNNTITIPVFKWSTAKVDSYEAPVFEKVRVATYKLR